MIRRLALLATLPLALVACGQAAEESEADLSPAAVALASGENLYRQCVACHSIDKGGRNGAGPNLHGIVGKAVASAQGFSYSEGMKAKGGVWDEAALDAYLENPRKAVAGTRMGFAGISDPAERKTLIAYLAAQK
jgi:cytochrome c